MVRVCKLALKNGFKPYAPVTLKQLPPLPVVNVEPGRLDIRCLEFNKKVPIAVITTPGAPTAISIFVDRVQFHTAHRCPWASTSVSMRISMFVMFVLLS